MRNILPYRQPARTAFMLFALAAVVLMEQSCASTVIYPSVSSLLLSTSYHVTVNGQAATVRSYNGFSYVWFGFDGAANVTVTVSDTISSYTISPKSYGINATVTGPNVSFSLSKPMKLVLHNVNAISEPLFIFADPLETNAPSPGGPGVVNVLNFGADASGTASSTNALQNAINAANGNGGGTVYVPPGLFSLAGQSLFLKSNVNLYLSAGAVLQIPPNVQGSFTDGVVIPVMNLSNATISGRGVIYGNGSSSQPNYTHVIQAHNVTNFQVKDVLLLDGNTTLLRFGSATNSCAANVKIMAGSPNLSDGIDLDGGTSFSITNCFIFSSDDNIAIGSGADVLNYNVPASVDGVSITGNVFYHTRTGHVCSIVPHIAPPYIQNLLMDNNDSVTVQDAIGIYPSNGFVNINAITFRNLRCEEVRGKNIDMISTDFYSWGGPPNGFVSHDSGSIHNIRFENLTFDNFGPDWNVISGRSATQNIDTVVFQNLRIAGNLILNAAAGHFNIGPFATNITFEDAAPPPPPPPGIYLSDLTPTFASNGWGPYEKDMSNGEQAAGDGHTLTINGVTYAKGLGVHAYSELRYALNGNYSIFQSDVGIDAEVAPQGSVVFQLYTDGNKIFDSGLVTGTSATQHVSVSVAGAQELKLIVTDGGNGIDYDHSDWALARLTPANHPPVIVSAASAVPNPASIGQTVSFAVAATDADNVPLAYTWDFGDGASGSGATASHVYTAAGSYTAAVTVSDGRGGAVTSSVAVSVAQPGIQNGAIYNVVNKASGKLLDVSGISLIAGAPVIQWYANGGLNQRWKFEDMGGGYYRLTAQHSGMVLDVAGLSQAENAGVIQWPWNGGGNQLWKAEDMGGGLYRLTAKHSGKCLSPSGGSLSDGARAVQTTWTASDSQLWTLKSVTASAIAADSVAPDTISSPIGLPGLSVTRATGRFSTKAPGRNALAFSVMLPQAVSTAAGTVVRIDFAGATAEFTLDKAHAEKTAAGTLSLKSRPGATSVQARLSGDFAAAWAANGLSGEAKTVTTALSIEVAGETFTSPVTLHYINEKGESKFSK